jgi:preprotein translocase subunit YajC
MKHTIKLSKGDAVRHIAGIEGVVVVVINRRQVAVQTAPGHTEVFYTANLTVI